MNNKKLWIILVVIIALAGAGFFFRDSVMAYIGGGAGQASAQDNRPNQTKQTVTIRPAADSFQVSAAGNLALANQYKGVLKVEGIITDIAVEPGDHVSAGDLLVVLDTSDLERAVQRAELALAIAQNQLEQLQEPSPKAEVDAAWASLASAKENLAELQAGPSVAELEAAQAGLLAAQDSYQELLDGLSEPELTQLSADLHKAFITLQQAQAAYNRVAYRDDVGTSQEALDLQTATIDYDTTKAAFDIATESASAGQVQTAIKGIKDAQVQLEALEASKAELASAEAQVASAEASLATLLNGPGEGELRAAELAIEETRLDLDEARANLAQAELRAKIDGTVLTVDVEVGQRATEELSALTYADLTDMELPVHVAEVDIGKVEVGQPVNLAVDALPDQTFKGQVSRITPISEAESGVVNYEVTIQLIDLELEDGVLPGMTAVATILGEGAENAWLVPTSALVEFEGESSVLVRRDGKEQRITVIPVSTQGEWTVVQADELQAGDQVAGEVTSFLDEEDGFGGPRGGFLGGGGGAR
jgi:HlyD family secretion protein